MNRALAAAILVTLTLGGADAKPVRPPVTPAEYQECEALRSFLRTIPGSQDQRAPLRLDNGGSEQIDCGPPRGQTPQYRGPI